MYHTVFPSQMMVQIMGGQQANGQYPPSHTLHISSVNGLHQADFTQYGLDISSGHSGRHTIQVLVKTF